MTTIQNENIKLNVGGQVFQTTLLTLTKYSDSFLAKAIGQRDWKINGILKTEEGHYFFDFNPDYFKILLDWLRFGEITTDDANLLKGTMNIANGFGLKELVVDLTKALKNINPKKNSYPSLIRLRFRPEAPIIGNISQEVIGLGTCIVEGL